MNVRPYDQKQKLLLPNDVRDFLSPAHEIHLVNDIIERFDLSSFYEAIPEVGNPSYHPKLMIKILFYGLVQGITSSRLLARKCCSDVAYMYLAAMQKPDFRTISKFRIRHLASISQLFAQVVATCQDMGLVSMDHIAIDGTRLKANASASELFDRERAVRHHDRLKDEIRKRLDHMGAQDALEDQLYGEDSSGYEAPPELRNHAARIKKLDRLIKELHKEKKDKKKNLTDPDSEIQKTEFGKKPGYNGQVSVDGKHNVIVATDVTSSPSDVHQLKPMVEQSQSNTGKKLSKISADAGYSSHANLEYVKERGTDAYIPDKRYQHQIKRGNPTGICPYDKSRFTYIPEEDVYLCPAGAKAYPPGYAKNLKDPFPLIYTVKGMWRCTGCEHSRKGCTKRFGSNRTIQISGKEHLIDAMRAKLQTPEGKAVYRKRKQIVETAFGYLKHNMNLRSFTLRGLEKVRLEFRMWCMGYNLKKIILHSAPVG